MKRKFILRFKFFLSVLFLSPIIFTSCNNLTDAVSLEPTVIEAEILEAVTAAALASGQNCTTVSCKLNFGGALPSQIVSELNSSQSSVSEQSSRTAFPSIPSTDLSFTVTAVNTEDDTETYEGSAVKVDSTYNCTVPIPVTDAEKKYKIEVTVYHTEDDDNVKKQILSGTSKEFTISKTSQAVTVDDISLAVIDSAGGKGNLKLEILLEEGCGITRCDSMFSSTISGNKVTLTATDIDSYSYDYFIDFYDDNNNCLYSFKEQFNIFDNLTTNTWVQNASESRFETTTDGDGKKTTVCRITKKMVEDFKLPPDIYIDKVNGDSHNTGSFYRPVTELSHALRRIVNKDTDYNIYILGERDIYSERWQLKNTLKKDGSGNNNAKSLSFIGYNGLDNNGIPKDSLKNKMSTAAIEVITEVPITIKNLKIYGGSNSCGILLYSNTEVTLEEGTLITANQASDGGGIYLNNNSVLKMKGGTISETSATTGGAIYVYNEGRLEMSGSAYIPAGVDGVTGPGKNDIYLYKNTTIKIAGKLTPPAACTDGIVATITPMTYQAGIPIIELAAGVTDTSLPEAVAHFAITPDVDGQMWGIDSEGKLIVWPYIGTKAPETPKEVGDIVFNDGSSMPYSAYENLTTEKKNAKKTSAIALIYYKGTGLNDGSDTTTVRTLGVGLKHNNKNWCKYQASAHYLKVSPLESDKINGSNGLTLISEFLKANGESDDTGYAVNYPAFYYCKNYKLETIGSETESRIPSGSEFESGWYLPTYDEIRQIYINGVGDNKKFDINTASKALGGSEFSNTYNTATQWSLKDYNDRYSFIYLMIFSGSNAGTSMNGNKNGGSSGPYTCAIREF